MRIYCKTSVYLGKCFRPGVLCKNNFNVVINPWERLENVKTTSRPCNKGLSHRTYGSYRSKSSHQEQSLRSLGIGLGQWPEHCENDFVYKSIIETTLFRNNDIANTIEIGFLDNHDLAFANAYRSVVEGQSKLHVQPPLGETDKIESGEWTQNDSSPYVPPKIHILWRIGYRFEENTHPLWKDIKKASENSSKKDSDAEANPKSGIEDAEAPVTSSSFLDDGSAPNIYPRRKPFWRKHMHDVVQVDDSPQTRIKLLQPPKLVHNISPDYIHHVLNPNGKHDTLHQLHSESTITQKLYDIPPLVQLKQDFPEQITLTVVLHNPESQLSRYYTAQNQNHPSIAHIRTPQDFLESLFYSAFHTLQEYCSSKTGLADVDAASSYPMIDGYGVISNGLSLSKDHPLHVSYHSILNAAKRVYQEDSSRQDEPKFRAIQLPVNAMETNGFYVAKQIKMVKHREVQSSNEQPTYISNTGIYAIRPLTCYSDGGTGSGGGSELSSKSHPFSLIDYKIEMKKDKKVITEWTNMMHQPPPEYNAAYQRAIQLFDAQDILEKQMERRREKQRENEENNISPMWTDLVKDLEDYLTDEERETLHGCQLLQNMIQKLDSVLEDARSIKTHELLLSTEVIPTLRDKFESYDENTSYTLESYFTAYSKAMHYHVAKNTRQLLRYGESLSTDPEIPTEIAAPTYGENVLPKEKRLQEFGFELLLNQTTGPSAADLLVFDVIMVGLSNLEEVYDTLEIFKKLQRTSH